MEERPIEGPGAPHAGPALAAPDLSPEARRRHAQRWAEGLEEAVEGEVYAHHHIIARTRQVLGRTLAGVWNDGFIHAGNLAYMAVVALFPFFIVATAIFSAVGERSQREAAINAVLLAVPHSVAKAIDPVAHVVIDARSGNLLWIGGLVGLWTVGSLIETIRDVLRRAYGTKPTHAFWRYRLSSSAITGAAPVPVPPPSPAVTNTMSAPLRASLMSSRDSAAAPCPICGFAPAPRPLVRLAPMCSLRSASVIWSAWASVFAAMNSTPDRPASIIRLTALVPPPPTPTTLMTAR